MRPFHFKDKKKSMIDKETQRLVPLGVLNQDMLIAKQRIQI